MEDRNMDELELLKKHWNKQTDFPKISKNEFYNIIQKKSLTTLQWMIVINILELLFFASLSFIFSDGSIMEKYPVLEKFIQVLSGVTYALPVIFAIVYVWLIRKIKVTNSVAHLMKNIFQARKLLNIYIYFNIIIAVISFTIGFYIGIQNASQLHPQVFNSNVFIFILIMLGIISLGVFILIFWLFYKLLYGRFLKRLKQNYVELSRTSA